MSDGLRLLASLLEHSSTVTFGLLERSDFVDQQELVFYDYIQAHHRRYARLPSIDTAMDDLGTDLPETPETVDYYLNRLQERTVYNGVREELGDLRDALRDMDIETIIRSSRAINSICAPRTGQQRELVDMSDLATMVRSAYDLSHGRIGVTGIPTGSHYLDAQTNGYQNGDLIVWVARPSAGKTHMLINSSRAAMAAGKSVLVVSMEMPLAQMGTRYAAHEAGLDPRLIRQGKLSYWMRKRFEGALFDIGEQRNFHLFAGNFKKNTDDIDILIQELAPDIIYIDGIYLMRPANAPSKSNRFESSAYVVDELKSLTLRRDRPIVGTTQFGRGAKEGGSEGNLENIGYTDTIGTHASVVVGIKLGQKVYKQIKHVVDGEIRVKETKATFPYRHLTLLKGREGEAGEWGMNFQFTPVDFEDIPLATAVGASGGEPGQPEVDHMQ